MNYTSNDNQSWHQQSANGGESNNQSVELLELFAEDLPVQQDLRSSACLGCLASASTFGGTVGTLSTFSTG
jgi:hypothetical protein